MGTSVVMKADGTDITQLIDQEADAYRGEEDRPLGSYVALLAAYGIVVAFLSFIVRITGRRLPERFSAPDLALLTIATHKVARILTKDPVTSPVRAPFTLYAGTAGEGEVAEEVRGRGLRHALGELMTCPFCLGQWVATGFAFGFVAAPRHTRLVASTFAALTGADFLQFAYSKAQQSQQD